MKIFDLQKSLGKFLLQVERMELPAGKIYGIIGPNGCGKTTIMKIMAGLLKPDSGYIDYEGLLPRDITMVFRKPYLIHDTITHNLVYPLKIRGIKPDQKLIEEYLEIAGLSGRGGEYAPGLSAGEQQKLSLLRAVIFSPKLVFIDEAFSNLDMESTKVFEQLILSRQQSVPAASYVICAHQLSHIQRMCEHVFFIHQGQVEASGPALEILTSPQNPNLKSYLKNSTLI